MQWESKQETSKVAPLLTIAEKTAKSINSL